ncbi:Ima1 N-terminal domain-containing protein [Thermothelomyces heterothallicus CBS 202.75]|uniref:Ima1 N-terminal domain-containing protein n=1 Tax=Thermothelomyces heterothallicus CBS 202.75 TaxID=1149848 RepID=UPI0037431CC4
MPRLYRNRYLTCFYCGRKTSTRYDGKTRRFDCPFCDATNYLDENGDITDPPVATETESTPRQFAAARPFSPPSSPPASDVIFCDTCLKNQHLLNASLAQYLPDPDDPDYAEREKGLYRFRRNQERLYPQICEQCEPKVRQRLEKAQYTAKTDLLRRMLDRSASARSRVTTRGWPERFDAAGRWLWIAGFVLQLGWHAVVVHSLLSQYLIWAEADDARFPFRLLRICGPLVGSLPSDERLLGWSSLATILGVWWNPRFSQVYRGFTRHINGVSKWYCFQAMAVGLRVCLRRIDGLTTPDPALLSTQTAAHALALTFALLILTLAPRCIRINMAPLFGTPHTTQQPLRDDPPEPSSTTSRHDETKTIADLLDEISRSPVSPTPPSPTPTDASSPSLPRRRANALPMGHTHTQAAQNLTASLREIDNLHLNLSPRRQPAASAWGAGRPYSSFSRSSPPRSTPDHGEEEMDWSPTPSSAVVAAAAATTTTPTTQPPRSKYRAFNTQGGQRANQPFGSAPTSDEKAASKPFWYRVPPAPTTPAQRVFNPPNQPRLRPSPVEATTPTPSFRFGQQRDSFAGGGSGKKKGLGFSSFSSSLSSAAAAAAGDGNGAARDNDAEVDGSWGEEQQQQQQQQQRRRKQQQDVTFAEPRFFAEMLGRAPGVVSEERKNDPRNELSGLFGESFRLTEEEKKRRGWWPRFGRAGKQGKKE